jgi:hypothetical protein
VERSHARGPSTCHKVTIVILSSSDRSARIVKIQMSL